MSRKNVYSVCGEKDLTPIRKIRTPPPPPQEFRENFVHVAETTRQNLTYALRQENGASDTHANSIFKTTAAQYIP
jgi:hypothetical protein